MALPLLTTCSLAWTGNRELMLRITLFQSPGLEVFVPAVQPNHIGALQRRVTKIMTELFDRWQSQSSQRRAHTMRNPASSPNFNDDRVERPSIPLRLKPDLIVVLQELGLVPDRDVFLHGTSEFQPNTCLRLPREEVTVNFERCSTDLVRKDILGPRSPEFRQVKANAPVAGPRQ